MLLRSLIAEFREGFPNRLGVNITTSGDGMLPRQPGGVVKEPRLSGTARGRFVKSRNGSSAKKHRKSR